MPSTTSTHWVSVRLRWKRLRRLCTAFGPALKQGQPELAIISTSRIMRSACLRQARKPWMHSTCSKRGTQPAYLAILTGMPHGSKYSINRANAAVKFNDYIWRPSFRSMTHIQAIAQQQQCDTHSRPPGKIMAKSHAAMVCTSVSDAWTLRTQLGRRTREAFFRMMWTSIDKYVPYSSQRSQRPAPLRRSP